jgi:maleate isomerase
MKMSMYGHRARIGYTSPPIVTEVFPYEFYKMAPPGVTLVLTTLMVARHSVESGEAQESWNHTLRAAREMARAKVNIIVFGGGPVVYSGGQEQAEKTMQALQQELGIPVTNSSTAYHQADAALGAQIVGSVSYASPPGAADHLPGERFMDPNKVRVVGQKYGGVPFIEVGCIPSELPLQMARELKQEHPEIDTLHLGSPHWATGAIIEPLEQELGVNVVQGSQAILWWALRSLGIDDRIQGFGKLLREH